MRFFVSIRDFLLIRMHYSLMLMIQGFLWVPCCSMNKVINSCKHHEAAGVPRQRPKVWVPLDLLWIGQVSSVEPGLLVAFSLALSSLVLINIYKAWILGNQNPISSSVCSLPKVALKTVPILIWLITDRSRPWRVECRPLPFSTPLSFRINAVMLWPVHVQKFPQAYEHLCPAKLQTTCDICCAWQYTCPFIPTDSGVPRTVDPQKSLYCCFYDKQTICIHQIGHLKSCSMTE